MSFFLSVCWDANGHRGGTTLSPSLVLHLLRNHLKRRFLFRFRGFSIRRFRCYTCSRRRARFCASPIARSRLSFFNDFKARFRCSIIRFGGSTWLSNDQRRWSMLWANPLLSWRLTRFSNSERRWGVFGAAPLLSCWAVFLHNDVHGRPCALAFFSSLPSLSSLSFSFFSSWSWLSVGAFPGWLIFCSFLLPLFSAAFLGWSGGTTGGFASRLILGWACLFLFFRAFIFHSAHLYSLFTSS